MVKISEVSISQRNAFSLGSERREFWNLETTEYPFSFAINVGSRALLGV